MIKKVSMVMMGLMMLLTTQQSTFAENNTLNRPEAVQLTQDKLTRADAKASFKTSHKHKLNEQVNLKDVSRSLTKTAEAGIAATTQTYSGTIGTQGDSAMLYPIYASPGEILQVQLDSPRTAQVDYDLYLYEFDMTTGDLIPTPIDTATFGTHLNTYADGAKTLPENVGTKNATAGDKAYLVEVYAKQGASINEPFNVTVSTSSTYDAFETDENAFHAYNFTVGTGGSSLTSRTLNSEVDNDWYVITVPGTRNYDAMNVTLDSVSAGNGYKAEVYSVLTNNRMNLLASTGNNVTLATGTYYVRVYTTGTYVDTQNYTLTLKPVLRAGKVVITGFDSAGGPNDYPSYMYGRYYRITGSSFTVKGVVATTDNFAVANQKVDVTWVNENWTESSGNRVRTGSAYTNANGEFTVTLSMPASTGSIAEYLSGAISFTHYYDLSAVSANVSGNSSLYDSEIVYHFAYSIYGG